MSQVEMCAIYICLTKEFHNFSFTGRGLSNWDVSNVYNVSSMFKGTKRCVQFRGHRLYFQTFLFSCSALASIISFNADLSNWDTSSLEDMESIFQDAVVSVYLQL